MARGSASPAHWSVQVALSSQLTSQDVSQLIVQTEPAVQFTVEPPPTLTVHVESAQSTSLSGPAVKSHSLPVQSKSAVAPPLTEQLAPITQSTSESAVVVTMQSLPA